MRFPAISDVAKYFNLLNLEDVIDIFRNHRTLLDFEPSICALSRLTMAANGHRPRGVPDRPA